jgi:threonylcarbamoyladenosine tRNA methylthiotransferase MtaB
MGLLRAIENLEGLGRIRLSSLDPRFLDEEMCDFITNSPIVCPHFHISLQHGSDDVLRRMGRKIKVADYKRILHDLRQKCPKAAFGADLIVGFPGEKEKDFEGMFEFVAKSPLTHMHVFSYSKRPGTPAARWNQVEERVKKSRATRLRKLAKTKNKRFRQSLAGDVWDGIVIRRKDGSAQILTSNYVQVQVSGCGAGEREQVQVQITQVNEDVTRGQVVD